MASKVLSPKSATKLLNDSGWDISERTTRRWCKTNVFKSAVKIVGSWAIPETDVTSLLHPDKTKSTRTK